jgi:hypothetical protein
LCFEVEAAEASEDGIDDDEVVFLSWNSRAMSMSSLLTVIVLMLMLFIMTVPVPVSMIVSALRSMFILISLYSLNILWLVVRLFSPMLDFSIAIVIYLPEILKISLILHLMCLSKIIKNTQILTYE